jgi:hypothetical protein
MTSVATLTIKLNGAEATIQLLSEFNNQMRRETVMTALRKAARPIIQRAKAQQPPHNYGSHFRQAGSLRNNIKSFASKIYKGANDVIGIYITVRATRKTLKLAPVSGDPFYFRFVEGGHKIVRRPRRILRGVISITARRSAVAYVKPYPFLGPAFNTEGKAAIDIFDAYITNRVSELDRLFP